MKLLLDTHIAIWATFQPDRLPDKARRLLENPETAAFVSAASIWEIAIKHAIVRDGRRGLPFSGADALHWFRQCGFQSIPVTPAHAAAVDELAGHHSDPFDRLLVAQALTEPLRLLTADRAMLPYGEIILPV